MGELSVVGWGGVEVENGDGAFSIVTLTLTLTVLLL